MPREHQATLFVPGQKYVPKNHSIVRMVEEYESNYKEMFARERQDWNTRIREFMRDETGLKLASRKAAKDTIKDSTVEVVIKSDRGDEFMRLIDENFPDLDFDEFSQLRVFQEVGGRSQVYFKRGQTKHSIKNLLNHCEEYFERYNLDDIINRLFAQEAQSKDIWGMYTCRTSKVEIYYLPIIIFCKLTNISIGTCNCKGNDTRACSRIPSCWKGQRWCSMVIHARH